MDTDTERQLTQHFTRDNLRLLYIAMRYFNKQLPDENMVTVLDWEGVDDLVARDWLQASSNLALKLDGLLRESFYPHDLRRINERLNES